MLNFDHFRKFTPEMYPGAGPHFQILRHCLAALWFNGSGNGLVVLQP